MDIKMTETCDHGLRESEFCPSCNKEINEAILERGLDFARAKEKSLMNATSPLKISCPSCHTQSAFEAIETFDAGEWYRCPHCSILTNGKEWVSNQGSVLLKDTKKKKSKILDRLVVLKVCFNRMGTYSQIVTFFGVWMVVLHQFGISLWWLLGFIVLLPLGMWLDDRYVHSREIDFIFDKSEALGRSKKK